MQKTKITFHVADMSCDHCAQAVKNALEEEIKGAKAEVHLADKSVDLTAPQETAKTTIAKLIADSGYTAKF